MIKPPRPVLGPRVQLGLLLLPPGGVLCPTGMSSEPRGGALAPASAPSAEEEEAVLMVLLLGLMGSLCLLPRPVLMLLVFVRVFTAPLAE